MWFHFVSFDAVTLSCEEDGKTNLQSQKNAATASLNLSTAAGLALGTWHPLRHWRPTAGCPIRLPRDRLPVAFRLVSWHLLLEYCFIAVLDDHCQCKMKSRNVGWMKLAFAGEKHV
jgi:hypothetical protein